MDQPDYTKQSAQRGLGLQLAIASSLGISTVIAFSLWRRRWPRFYAARTFRRPDLPVIPDTMFGWMTTLYKTSDSEVLEYAGLDAFVFLMFFRAAFDMLFRMALISFLAIGPLRWYYTGKYDEDDVSASGRANYPAPIKLSGPSPFLNFHWVYVVFTYLFTGLCLYILRRYTSNIVRVRQEYLGRQNSITDRTLRVTGIPKKMRSIEVLTEYLKIVKVSPRSVALCYDWSTLDMLFLKRKELVHKLEDHWADYLGPTYVEDIDMEHMTLPTVERRLNPATGTVRNVGELSNGQILERPRGRVERFGTKGPAVDLIDYYTAKLHDLDEKIRAERKRTDIRVTSTAFITLESVSSCQMAAQTLLSPKAHVMLTHLAPAPHDVIWRNTYLTSFQRSFRTHIVTFVFLMVTVLLSLPVSYLARFLDIDTIIKYAPWLGKLLERSDWLETFVTQVLTTYIFTLFNVLVPYFFSFLSRRQGHISREDVELSTLTKNFLYVFVNLFLVFTIAQNYISLLRDTTQIAVQLAGALRRLSTFYTNLIVLQGIGILPTRLLQAGSIIQLPFFAAHAKTARDYHGLYKPPALNYGLLLPTPLLLLIIVLMYSVLNGRMVAFGALYFYIGYFVYKYQFMYSMVHPQHSTGRLWTLICRRFWLGLGLFQLAMIGVLVLESAYIMATMLIPLPVLVLIVWYEFEKFTEPLLRFIALEAVKTTGGGTPEEDDSEEEEYHDDADFANQTGISAVSLADSAAPNWAQVASNSRDVSRSEIANASVTFSVFDTDSENSSVNPVLNRLRHRQSRTLDEDRELNHQYVNQNIVSDLEGPWIGVEGNECVMAVDGGLRRRRLSFCGWE